MATTFVRVRDPEQVAELEMAGLLWWRNPSGNCVHIASPRNSELSHKQIVAYWRDCGVLLSERCGYMSEE